MGCDCKYIRLSVLTSLLEGGATVCGNLEKNTFGDPIFPQVWWATETFHSSVTGLKHITTFTDFGIYDHAIGDAYTCDMPSVSTEAGGLGDDSYEYSGSSVGIADLIGAAEAYADLASPLEGETDLSRNGIIDDYGAVADWYHLLNGPSDPAFQLGAVASVTDDVASFSKIGLVFKRQFSKVPIRIHCQLVHSFPDEPDGDPTFTEITIPSDSNESTPYVLEVTEEGADGVTLTITSIVIPDITPQ